MTLNNLIDKAGEWNPQIFREFKQRVNFKNIGSAALVSLIVQVFTWLYFDSLIPVPKLHQGLVNMGVAETYDRYCRTPLSEKYSDICTLNGLGGFNINWQIYWSDIFQSLSWILPLGLMLGAVYLLVADLIQEEKRGTLNFIRLSPQSARTIFIGKILGVPSLVYLAVALGIPFHLFAGLNAGGNIPLLLGWYLTIGSMWFLSSSIAVLYVLLGGIQAILTVMVVSYPIAIPLLAINSFASATINHDQWLTNTSDNITWFWLPIAGSALWFYAFGIGCCLVASHWVWLALERRYLNPTATILGKSQSYVVNLGLQIWLAGFALPSVARSADYKEGAVVSLAILDFMVLLALIPLLLPTKQALQDWSRYRREHLNQANRQLWQRDLVQDLIRHEKSPAILAIALNIGMALVLWVPVGLISLTKQSYGIRFIAGLCLATSLILIYATIAHLGLFFNFKKRNLWIVAIVSGMMFLPMAGAFLLSPYHTATGLAAIFLLFSPLAPMGIIGLAGSTILATFGAQLALLAGLTHQFQRKLQIAGQSETVNS